MRRTIPVIAAALLLQLSLTGVGHATGATVEATVDGSTERGVRVAGHEISKISNPLVTVSFDVQPDLVGVSVEEFGPFSNPQDTACGAEHDPLGAGTANMNVVADLKAGASGEHDIFVEYTETQADGTVTTHHVVISSGDIGPVGPEGEVHRVPICIFE